MVPRDWTRTALTTAVALVGAAVLSWAVASNRLAVVSTGSYGETALDSIAATIGTLLAYLLYGRFVGSWSRRDALLCTALLVLATANLTLSVLPLVLGAPERLATPSAASGLGGAVLVAAAAWARESVIPLVRRRQVLVTTVLGVLAVLVLATLAGLVLPRTAGGSAETVGGTPDVLLTALQVAAGAAFLVAAVGWCRPGVQGDRMALLLATACVLGAVSRADFALADSASSPLVTAGTLLRVGFYLTLVASAVGEIRSYWSKVAQVAVLEERRRIARDLHDGMAQELAFMATQARALADRSEHPTRARLVAAAAERALDESRRAIAALTRPLDESLDVAVVQCAEEVCGRLDAQLQLDVEDGLDAAPDAREAVLRIVREAISNAVRHGHAHEVVVRLSGPSPLRLRVEDDGVGFDPTDLTQLSGRFGLVSMRERAEALGGSFALAPRAPHGTTVEVLLP